MFFNNLLFFGNFIHVYDVSLSHLALPLPASFLKFLILIIEENVWQGRLVKSTDYSPEALGLITSTHMMAHNCI